MAAALPFIMIASTVFSVMSALNQGQAQNQAAQTNAAINDQNATIARQNAADKNVMNQRDNIMRLGAVRAAQGKSGGAGDSGSVLDVLGDVAAQGELDKQYTSYQGELQARGYTNTAALDRQSGQNAVTGSYFKAGSELLGGGAKVSDYYGRQSVVRA